VRTHAEHLEHMLNLVLLSIRVGHCVRVGTHDRIYKTTYTQGLDVKMDKSTYSIFLDVKE